MPMDATAYAHRDRRMIPNVAAIYDDEDVAAHEDWADEFASALSYGSPRPT